MRLLANYPSALESKYPLARLSPARNVGRNDKMLPAECAVALGQSAPGGLSVFTTSAQRVRRNHRKDGCECKAGRLRARAHKSDLRGTLFRLVFCCCVVVGRVCACAS